MTTTMGDKSNVDGYLSTKLLIKQLYDEVEQIDPKSPTSSLSSSTVNGTKILRSIETLLTSWENNEGNQSQGMEEKVCEGGSKNHQPSFPLDLIRLAMSRGHKALGSGHSEVPTRIFDMLRNVKSRECRSVILEFIPLVLSSPNTQQEFSIANVMRVGGRNNKKELLGLLKLILQDDATLLKQIFDTLSNMITAGTLAPRDIFRFSLDFLPKTPETELHSVIQAMIRYAEGGTDAMDVVDAIRTEFSLLEQTDVSDMFSIVTIFDDAMRGLNGPMIMEQYIARCEEIVEESCLRKDGSASARLSVFDLAVLLLAKTSNDYLNRIVVMVHEATIAQSNIFLGIDVAKVVQLLNPTQSGTAAGIRERLIDEFLDICLTMLLSSSRCKTRRHDKNRSGAAEYMVSTVALISTEFQKRSIKRLFDVWESCISHCQKQGLYFSKNELKLRSLSTKDYSKIRICMEIPSMIVDLATTARESMISFLPQLIGYLEHDHIHTPHQESFIVDQLATAIVALSTSRESKETLVILCRKLLFARMGAENDAKGTSKIIHCQQRGLSLIHALATGDSSPGLLSLCGRFMTRLLGKSLTIMDLYAGEEAISIVKHLHFCKGVHIDGKELLEPILSKIRLIQYSKTLSGSSSSQDTLVTYAYVPMFLQRQNASERKPKFNPMTCTFSAICTIGGSLQRPTTWKQSATWLSILLETYLTVGRPTKWIPHAWTEAGMEFPTVPKHLLQSSDECSHFSSYLQESFGRVGARDGTKEIDLLIHDVLQRCSCASERKELLYFAHKFTIFLLLGISTTVAILNNVYDYYQGTLEGEGCHEKVVQIVLVQHQLVKMYDLRRHCISMQRFHSSAWKKKLKRKKGRSGKAKASASEQNAAADAIRSTLNYFFSTTAVNPRAVWVGLTDSYHDSFIISSLDSKKSIPVFAEDLASVLGMRLNMLSHLVLAWDSIRLSGNARFADLTQRIPQFLRMALFLSRSWHKLQEDKTNARLLTVVDQVSREYFRLLHKILVSLSGVYSDDLQIENDTIENYVRLYQSLVGSDDPLNDAIDPISSPRLLSNEDFKKLCRACLDHVKHSSSGVAMQLLETMSVFAVLCSRFNKEALGTMVDIHWETMKLSSSCDVGLSTVETPFAIDYFFQRFGSFGCLDESDMNLEQVVLKETLQKLISVDGTFAIEPQSAFLKYMLCRHWSLIALSPRPSMLLGDHLTRFVAELRGFLEDNDKPQEISVPVTIGPSLATDKDEGDSKEDAFVLENKKALTSRNVVVASDSFPMLDSGSCTAYFDTIFKLSVASIGIFSAVDEAKACQLDGSWSSAHPFTILENYFEVCGTLLEIVRDANGRLLRFRDSSFPFSVVQTLKLLLKTSVEKIESCIDWRNNEVPPSPEEVAAGAYDPARKQLLKEMIDSFCVEILGSVDRLCTTNKNDRRLNSIRRHLGKALDAVRQVCIVFDLGEVKTDYSDESDHGTPPQKCKRRKLDGGKPPHFDASTIEEDDDENEGVQDEHLLNPEENDDRNFSSEYESERNSSDEDSDAFGVSGDWMEDYDDNDDDNSSQKLGEIRITY